MRSVEAPDVNALNDGDEFVDDEPPPSDHMTSRHYWLDMAAMRARGEKRRRALRAFELEGFLALEDVGT